MKKGKDDEKIVEPLFPRLHVKDADKGGPRAPPRNKMALYEQLSIPSQRFNQQAMVPLSASNTSSLVPPGPSNQACGSGRNPYFHHKVSSSTPKKLIEKFVAEKSCFANVRSLARHDQRKMVGEEDDFTVPVFLNSGRVQSHDRTKGGVDNETLSPAVAASCLHSVGIQEANAKDMKNGSLSASSRQDVGDSNKENQRQGTVMNLLAREEMKVSRSVSKSDRGNNAHLRQESTNRLDQDDGETVVKGTDISLLRGESHSGKGHSSPDEVDNDHDCCRSLSSQQRNGEASDGVSETSMVDSISSADISPDDVVGIIGQKRFWKARRAIANQQRVFAVQVFELHRLIKVQRLIAESPHLLLDDGTYLGKSSPKGSPVKKLLTRDYVVKPVSRVLKRKDDSEKDNRHEMECSAENAVGRTTTTSVSSGVNPNNNSDSHHHHRRRHQPSNAPAAAETPMATSSGGGGGLWCFPPQPVPGNHQWLVPVMSPSEGLIYKPYPSPGHVGSACGGYYGHFMPAPMAVSGFMGGPVYGVTASPPPYHPGIGFPGYFPILSGQQQPHTDQVNQFGHLVDAQQQSSCNFPNSSGTTSAAAPPQPQRPATEEPRPQNGERQGSTGSSASERGGSGVTGLSLFPTAENSRGNERLAAATATTAVTMQGPSAMRVIRVVPHNPKAASESAARIFRSIQEERKQYDSL